MSDKKYDVRGVCPKCGKQQTLAIEAGDALPLEGAGAKALAAGAPPKALAQCADCGEQYQAPITEDTCAEWDDFCKAVHPIQEY